MPGHEVPMRFAPQRGTAFLFGVLIVLSPATLSAQETRWLQFRGPGGLGVSTARGVPSTWNARDNILYKITLPGAGSSSPILLGNRLILTCYLGYGEPGKAGAMNQLKRNVLCLDAKSGDIVWRREVRSRLPEEKPPREGHGFASSTPVADDERIYTFFGKSGVFAHSHDGRELWHADVGDGLSGWGSAASPILYKDLVIVNASVESDSLVALDRRTGKEVWRARGMRESWNTPVLVPIAGAKTELAVAIMGKVLGIDPDSGKQLWSCATDIAWYMAPSPVADGGVVYCIGGRDGGGALAVRAGGRGDVTRTHRAWLIRKTSNVSSPIIHNGHLYWMHDSLGVAYCADAKTGKLIYEERIPQAGQVYASPVLADGKLFYVTRNGRTFVLPAQPRFEVVAVNDLADRSTFNASPAVADGKLFLRSDRFLYCIGKK